MAYEHNDIATKNRLRAALGEENMGFEHNDIVTTDVMNAAIAGGGGGGDITWLIENAQATVALDADLEEYVAIFQFPESVTPENYYEVFSGKNVVMTVDGEKVETPALVTEESGSFYYFSPFGETITYTVFSPDEFRIVIYGTGELQGETVTLSLGITD